MPKNPLSVNNIIDDAPVVDIATLIMTVDNTKPVFLVRLLKSVYQIIINNIYTSSTNPFSYPNFKLFT